MFKFSPKGTLAGGIVAILWCLFSWIILPWHHFTEVKNELELTGVISSSLPEKGVYILPNIPDSLDDESLKNYQERKLKGPSGIFFVSPVGVRSFGFSMVLFLFGVFFVSFLFSILLNMVLLQSILQKAILVSLAAMAGGVACIFPYFVWWHFPFSYIMVHVLDIGFGWFLGGMALAKYSETNIDINFRLFPINFLKRQKIRG
jgi:hypothetical protein